MTSVLLWYRMLIVGEAVPMQGLGPVLSAQLCCELETTLKKVYLKKMKNKI